MKILMLVFLYAFIGIVFGGTMGWKNCSLNFEVETNVTLAYLSQDGLHQISISTKSNETYLSEHEERFLSLCLCRTNFGQQFFVSPIQNETETIVHDAIILCLVGFDSFESIGIYDDYDLLDALLLKQFEHIPNSIIDPVKNHPEDKEHTSEDKSCYDFYGFPAKDILGQKTCLLSVDISNERKFTYSGPLMGNAMAFNSIESCNSSVNGSIGAVNLVQKNDDYCDMSTSLETAKLQCCCIHEPQYCSPQSLTYTSGDDNKLYTLFYCLSGKANTSEYDVVQQSHITLQEYIMNNVNFFCTITISMQKETENVESIANAIVEYGAKNICESETIITLGSSESFCTFNHYFPKEIEIKKCCKNGHFCNKKFTPKKIKETFKCYYKFKYAAFLTTDDDPKCERFYDIWFKKDAFSKIIFHYNAKFPDGEKKHWFEINENYTGFYTYYKIIKADSGVECPKKNDSLNREILYNYNSSHINTYRPFYHVFCEIENCDFSNNTNSSNYKKPEKRRFKCQTLDKTLFDGIKINFSITLNRTRGWMCFVAIVFDEISHKNYISAGELTDFTGHENCLKNDTLNEKFCCIDVFDIPQNETICTVENMIEVFNLGKNRQSISANGDFSNCDIRDLPLDSCLSDSGCFETRLLHNSQHPDSIEPAGCIDNTEKYISQNIPMASLSLGCRTNENSNRCSVIQTPEGQQRILCCCNGKECENDLKELPEQVGKNISSFKGSE